MAAIKEYNSTLADSGLSPSQLGISSTEQVASQAVSTGTRIKQGFDEAGRAIGGGIAAVGEVAGRAYQQFVEQPDINQLALNAAKTSSDLSDSWKEAINNAPPGQGPKVQADFLQNETEDSLNDLLDGAKTKTGKQYAFDEAVKLRASMLATTTADVSTRAGQEVLTAMDEQKNVMSHDVYNNPSKLPVLLDMWGSAAHARVQSSAGLSVAQGAQIENTLREHGAKELVNSAILGAANQSPEAARALANDPRYAKYINAADADGMIKTAENLNRARDAAIRAEQTRQQNDRVHTAVNNINANITDPTTGKINVTPQSVEALRKVIQNDPTADPALFRAQFDFMNGRLKDEKVHETDPEVISDLTQRLTSAENPTTELQVIQAGSKLSDTDYNRLRQNVKDIQELTVKDPVFTKVMDGVKADMTYAVPGAPGTDPIGMRNYGDFTRKFIPMYAAAVRSGKATPDDLDANNPNSMISKVKAQYYRSVEQRITDRYAELGEGTTSQVPVIPAALKGIAALSYSPSTKRFYDQTTHKAYDVSGTEIK